jgi:hypothetical protein
MSRDDKGESRSCHHLAPSADQTLARLLVYAICISLLRLGSHESGREAEK